MSPMYGGRADWLPPEPDPGYDALGRWTRPHPRGVTWRNCPKRNRGCVACAQEWAQEPAVQEEAQEAAAERAGRVIYESKYSVGA